MDRNQLKRRLRELIRTAVLPNAGPLDIVIHARPEAYSASFLQLQTQLLSALSSFASGPPLESGQ